MKEPDVGYNFDDSGYRGRAVVLAVPPVSRVDNVIHVPQSDLGVDGEGSSLESRMEEVRRLSEAPAKESSSALERGHGCGGGGKVRGEGRGRFEETGPRDPRVKESRASMVRVWVIDLIYQRITLAGYFLR